MGNLFSGPETVKTGDVTKVPVDVDLVLKDFMFHLQSLDRAAESITTATDAQYDLVQNIIAEKGEPKPDTDHTGRLALDGMDLKEERNLAYLQDDICIQATVIKKTVFHIENLFKKISGTNDEKQSQEQHRHGNKKPKLHENINKNRMDINYFRGVYETQALQLKNTEERLNELCPSSNIVELHGRKNSESSEQVFKLTMKISDLEEALRKTEEELERRERRFKDDLTRETKKLGEDVDEYKRRNNKLSISVRDAEHENRSLAFKLEKLEREKNSKIIELQKELSRLKGQIESKRAQKTVFLYTQRRGELLSKVIVEFKHMLELQFNIQNLSLRVVDCENASEIETNKPVLVLCINASRLGTDVSNALTGIQGNGNVSVIVLHHKETHALPNQSSERVLTSAEYKSLGGIIDMAFLSNKGIYPCDMNDTALNVIVEFIKRRN